jgi:hypothetical protein
MILHMSLYRRSSMYLQCFSHWCRTTLWASSTGSAHLAGSNGGSFLVPICMVSRFVAWFLLGFYLDPTWFEHVWPRSWCIAYHRTLSQVGCSSGDAHLFPWPQRWRVFDQSVACDRTEAGCQGPRYAKIATHATSVPIPYIHVIYT